MSLIQKYQLPVYDPPANYNEFNGGINTSLSNEALQPNEIRDGLNCHYSNSAIINRPGASLLKRLLIPIETSRYQGDFIYAAKEHNWIISVRNGHIFYGIYSESLEIPMQLLHTVIEQKDLYDTENYLVDLVTVYDYEMDYTKVHEGFIYKYNPNKGGGEDPVTGEDNTESEDTDYVETLIIQNTKRVQGIPVDDYFLMATGTRILQITELFDEDNNNYVLQGYILPAKKPNPWEFKNIGVNNLSPYPNYHIAEVAEGTPKTEIGQILTEPKEFKITDTTYTFKAITACLTGYDKADFYYKWEVKKISDSSNTDWKVLRYWDASKNGGETSKGVYEIQVPKSNIESLVGTINNGDQLLIRCTLTSDFASTYDVASKKYVRDTDEDGDFVSDLSKAQYSKTHVTKVIGAEIGVDHEFRKMHSCTKVIADGQKALFYDDAYDSCEWYKSVIKQYNYITYNGNLSFKTTKNEKLVGVVVFDTNIVVFADNPQLGGNISVVTGNGDDYNDGDYYSPYKRNIVNTSVSCDSYNTIQSADNYIIFKYRNDIYMLDTSGLSNTDTVKVSTINDMVKQRLNNIEFPLNRVREPKKIEHLEYDFHELYQCLKPDEIFSEITDGYYGLIFPNQGAFVDTLDIPTRTDKYYEGSVKEYKGKLIEDVTIKPGLRWKCYYRDGKQYANMPKTLYPWLRDVSYLFDIVSVLYIEGVPCFVRKNGDLIKFDKADGVSYDNSGQFKLRFKSKAYDMEAPALCKFLDNLCIYYNRDFDDISYMTLWIHNEAAYEIYGPENEAFITLRSGITDQVRYGKRIKYDEALTLRDQDKPIEQYEDHAYIDAIDKPVEILNTYEGIKDESGNWMQPVLNRPSFTSKTYTPRWRFPFLSAQVTLEVRVNQAFSLSALNFSYTTSDMPDYTRERLYREIIRR